LQDGLGIPNRKVAFEDQLSEEKKELVAIEEMFGFVQSHF
jgi:hypothetical protein